MDGLKTFLGPDDSSYYALLVGSETRLRSVLEDMIALANFGQSFVLLGMLEQSQADQVEFLRNVLVAGQRAENESEVGI